MKWASIGVVTNDARVTEFRRKFENGHISWEDDSELLSYVRLRMHALQDSFRSMTELFGASCSMSASSNNRYDIELRTNSQTVANRFYLQARQKFPDYDFVFLLY